MNLSCRSPLFKANLAHAFLFIFFPFSLAFMACNSLQSIPLSPPKDDRFLILVAGEGISQTTSTKLKYATNKAEAAAMVDGVKLAYECSQSVKSILNLVSIQYQDDFRDPTEAAALAARYAANPATLAVIGHSSSGTTKLAAAHYLPASIPVLLPISTNPEVSGKTLFRLPLNDQVGQAPALVHLIHSDLHASQVYIVRDVSGDSAVYSDYLLQRFKFLLPADHFKHNLDIDIDRPPLRIISEEVHRSQANLVLFVGYGSTAVQFLESMHEVYSATTDIPTIVLTDGCISPDLHVYNFPTYLTSPVPDLGLCKHLPPCFSARRNPELPSYEEFGYDALEIISQAISKCKDMGSISRSCIASSLTNDTFYGLCQQYSFRNGENTTGTYTIYKITDGSHGPLYNLYSTLTQQDLHDIRD
ncbi:MAG: hypothetical protein LAP85_28035 [Acidobacteriia bacterium]|nr:hypothetical protein [Terriglobia bacterium]